MVSHREGGPTEDVSINVIRLVAEGVIAMARGESVSPPSLSAPQRDVELLLDVVTAQADATSGRADRVRPLVTSAIRDQIALTALVQDMFLFLYAASEALLAVGDDQGIAELVELLSEDRSRMPVSVRAQLHRLRAHLAVRNGDEAAAERHLRSALDDAETWGSPVMAPVSAVSSAPAWSARFEARRPSRTSLRRDRRTYNWVPSRGCATSRRLRSRKE